MTTPDSIKSHVFYVALVEAGVPKFSSSPVAHVEKSEARAEADRLAAAHPGKTFQLFRTAVDLVASYEAPKPKTFTGRELLKTAPAGVYKMRGTADAALRFIVMTAPARVCLYVSGRYGVEPLNSDGAWDSVVFELTDEDPQKVLRRA